MRAEIDLTWDDVKRFGSFSAIQEAVAQQTEWKVRTKLGVRVDEAGESQWYVIATGSDEMLKKARNCISG